jgi:DNA invertase Pin-like site-specific DNA recombinase
MDARTGYTDRMTQREPGGGALVRAVAYVRVSSEEQRRHSYSLDDQERELRIQIGLKGWELVEVVRDEGLSGADPSRPGLRRIEELAREGRVDVAFATKRNRWFRDIEHRRRYERGLRRNGARIAALNDSGNAIADGVDDLIGEEQRHEIARETRRGRRARTRKGEVVAGVVRVPLHARPKELRGRGAGGGRCAQDFRARREFWDNPEEEHIAVPIPDLGVPREHVEEAKWRVPTS